MTILNNPNNLPQILALQEGILIRDNIRMVNRRQYPDLIKRVLQLLFRKVKQFDLFQRIELLISGPLDLEDRGVCSFAWVIMEGYLAR